MKCMIALLTLLSLMLINLPEASGQQTGTPGQDRLVITTRGSINNITIDSLKINEGRFFPDSLTLSGAIFQEGQNNTIKITARKKQQRTTNNKQRTITITQQGKNNIVKINSR